MGRRIEPCALTIAGSDSGGNAGVQADLRAFHAYGLHGCTVVTALTAQNPRGVRSVHVAPPACVADQLDAVFEMYSVRALKTGILATADTIAAVAARLRARPRVRKVVDPVMVATSGAPLLAADAVAALAAELLPLATLITPNVPEAEALLGRRIASRDALPDAARDLARRFGCAVLVKGGHALAGGEAVDALYDGRRLRLLAGPAVPRPVSTHGTGCTLAAAIAAGLARGAALADAVADAKNYVYEAIRLSYHSGRNCGVLGMPARRR